MITDLIGHKLGEAHSNIETRKRQDTKQLCWMCLCMSGGGGVVAVGKWIRNVIVDSVTRQFVCHHRFVSYRDSVDNLRNSLIWFAPRFER